jgi:hypothetical protein
VHKKAIAAAAAATDGSSDDGSDDDAEIAGVLAAPYKCCVPVRSLINFTGSLNFSDQLVCILHLFCLKLTSKKRIGSFMCTIDSLLSFCSYYPRLCNKRFYCVYPRYNYVRLPADVVLALLCSRFPHCTGKPGDVVVSVCFVLCVKTPVLFCAM